VEKAAKVEKIARAPVQTYVGDMKSHVTKYEDTLPEIARQNDIGFNELRSANPYVDPWMPGTGVKMVIPTRHILPDAPHKGIVINLPEMRLYLYGKDGKLIQTHPIGIGREGLMTPVGTTTVVRKVVGPIWRPTARMRKQDPTLPVEIGPGPDNPMGTHALYLGWPQYAIHGTDKPYAIGRRASSGCIRMYPEDIKKVYPDVPVGDSVTVVNESVKAAWIDGRLYLEAHPPLDQAMMIEEDGGRPYYDLTDDDMREILRVAGDKADLIDWVKVRSVIRNREGYPVAVAEDPSQPGHDKSETVLSDVEDHAQEAVGDGENQADGAAKAETATLSDDNRSAENALATAVPVNTGEKNDIKAEAKDAKAAHADASESEPEKSDSEKPAAAKPAPEKSDVKSDVKSDAKPDVKPGIKPAAKKKAAAHKPAPQKAKQKEEEAAPAAPRQYNE
jgi:L,D-transpeptidase ErfK/SrfK